MASNTTRIIDALDQLNECNALLEVLSRANSARADQFPDFVLIGEVQRRLGAIKKALHQTVNDQPAPADRFIEAARQS